MENQISEYSEWGLLKRQIMLLENSDWRLPFTIAFCGGFSAGKSSLINTVLNCPEEYQLPTGIMPITKVVTHICYGSVLRCSYRAGEQICSVTGKQASQMIKGCTALPRDCKEVTIELPSGILKNGVHFLDTPGFNDEKPDGSLEQMSNEAIQRADYIIFCTNSTKCGSEFERDFLSKLQETKGNFCLVVNRMDALNTDEDIKDIQHKAVWLMKGKGRLGLYGNLNNVFYTVASGQRTTLDGFDKFLTELISREGVKQRIRRSTAARLGKYSAYHLKERLLADINTAKNLYDDICHRHETALHTANLQTASDVQRVSGETNDCINRSEAALERLNTEYCEMLTSLIAGKAVVSSYPKSFVDAAKTGLAQKVEQACKMTGQAWINGSSEAAQSAAKSMQNSYGRFEMPKIKPVWVKKRGFLGRAITTMVDFIELGDIFVDDGTEPEYRDYHQPIIRKVSQELIPNMRAARDKVLDTYLQEYAKGRMSNVFSGFEDAFHDAENNLIQLEEQIKKFQELEDHFSSDIEKLMKAGYSVNTQTKRTVLITGDFACGKNTLVNALLSRKVLYTSILPKDYLTTIHCGGQKEYAAVKYYTNPESESSSLSVEMINIEHLPRKLYEWECSEKREISSVNLYLNTPVTNILFESLVRWNANNNIKSADAVVYVMNIGNLFSYDERDYISAHFADYHMKNLFFIINHIDLLDNTKELEDLKKFVRLQLHRVFTDEYGRFDEKLFSERVFYTNAYGSFCSRIGEPARMMGMALQYDDSKSGITEFEHMLYWYLNSF